MKIMPVNDVLQTAGLLAPDLNVLRASNENYRGLFLQPHGDIEVSSEGVANKDANLAAQQYATFLLRAHSSAADLVLTPEYSMPWRALIDALRADRGPAQGVLWAIGCESVKVLRLESLQDELGPGVRVLYEPLSNGSTRFVDPLAYVFRATVSGTEHTQTQVVVLIQFKTHPMGDDDHFEQSGLELGSVLYQFGAAGQSIRLTTLLCSDAFAFTDADAKQMYDRGLIIHLQLNPSPRHPQYRGYRERLLQYQGDATEIVCLNWAQNVTEWCKDKPKPWKNISGSAWYLRPDKFDIRDATLDANHRKGLYYTWLQAQRCNALFMNYEPAVFEFESTKVAHIGVLASISRRRGPQLVRTLFWNTENCDWIEQPSVDDGFSAIVSEAGEAAQDIASTASRSPLSAERLLALSVGSIEAVDDWYSVRRLDSLKVDASEIILRLTYCQDVDETAERFRIARLRQVARLRSILTDTHALPVSLGDLKEKFTFDWTSDFPNTNVDASGGRATVVYVGEGASRDRAEALFKRLAENLRRGASEGEERTARQRLAVWFVEHDAPVHVDASMYVRIDEPDIESEFDIARRS